MSSLTFIPYGGSANRMRAMASAVNLSRRTGVSLTIIWTREWAMTARFSELFEPFHLDGVTFRDARMLDYWLYDRPRKKNLWIPSLPQRLLFDSALNERHIDGLLAEGFDFEAWARNRRTLMPCCMPFGHFDGDDYATIIRELFHPVASVMDKVNAYSERLGSHSIGVHVRRTDNTDSIKNSPLQAFYDALDKRLNDDTTIFLATDDEETKQLMRQRYGERIVTPDVPASRDSAEGVRDGLVDMWTLAGCTEILGSVGSSFSVMASTIGGKGLTLVGSPTPAHP